MRKLTIRIRTAQDFRLILRLTSIVSILTGVLSLLVIVLPQAFSPVIAPVLVRSPEESLGFVFIGFAIRLSRLEQYKRSVRLVLWTARYSLLAAGVLGAQGIGVLNWSGAETAQPNAPGLAISFCFILISCSLLTSHGRSPWSSRVTILLPLLGVFVASCWISMFLVAAGLVPQLPVFGIAVLPLLLVTLVSFCLALSCATPGLVELLVTDSPAAEVARQAFPAAICLPVVLAILRHWAENAGYVHPSVGLLAHVLISAGSMAAIVGWNIYRLDVGNTVRESIESAAQELESHYRKLLESISEPVWVFDGKGTITFSNVPARTFTRKRGESSDGTGASMLDVLGKGQYEAIVGSAVLTRQPREITLYDAGRGQGQIRQICFVGVLKSRSSPAVSCILVLAPIGVIEGQEVSGLQSLSNALKSEVPLPVQD